MPLFTTLFRMLQTKRGLLYLSALSILLIIIGEGIASISNGNCANGGASSCTPSTEAAVGAWVYAAGIVLSFFAWIDGMVLTVRLRHWIWFVLILLFSPIATLVYGFLGPAETPWSPRVPGGNTRTPVYP